MTLAWSCRNEEGALHGEQAVREPGADWTLVRSSFMDQNFSESFWLESVRSGELAVPAGDVAEPFIDAEDIAEAVGEIARATGREVRYMPVSPAQFASALLEDGLPADYVTALTEVFTEVLDGRNAHLTDGVQRALGREPRDFSDYARETAATGIWNVTAVRGPQ